jgi:hypothetical protein
MIASGFRQLYPEARADQEAKDCEALAKIYEDAKWRPWEGPPAVPEARYYEALVRLEERANLQPQAEILAQTPLFP